MAYLSCHRCGLSIRSRNPLTDRHFCPRCRARGRIVALVRSSLPALRTPRPTTRL